ncbi:hypothetical protein AURDEDRAFT_171726 [Auricularia subglabra TFB-10046 SS5]|nr:hypothetical protein AURDEDRAFT_171726 [Auricularia subglabra TFB-10046 SS5]
MATPDAEHFSHRMTFIAGSRSCIDFKLALVKIKVVLSALLAHFRFSPDAHRIHWVSASIYQRLSTTRRHLAHV